MENLHEKQIEVLELYIQLTHMRFGKTKKEKYLEINKRTKISTNTIISWIRRYLEEYEKIREELELKKYAKISEIEDLTEIQSKYLWYRMSGIGKEEAKIKAGYSPKTKVANIERSMKMATSIKKLREIAFQDVGLGALAMARKLKAIIDAVDAGVKETEYIDETNPDGRLVRRTVSKKIPLSTQLAAIKELNNMFGFNYLAEVRAEKLMNENDEEEVILDE
ncbi:MAG: hypothetical protein SPH94_08450 [Fusobacterium necrophorum]|uniref:hypothetical protein n=1 Tax=Fusobacterium necrophorum TaxID=859 RepID=UPI0021C3D8F3|nr:hypothetical protein [Fusobacterium necrophorum]MDY6173199.1 hypothetical protein [Fusobacterium necrophorum]